MIFLEKEDFTRKGHNKKVSTQNKIGWRNNFLSCLHTNAKTE